MSRQDDKHDPNPGNAQVIDTTGMSEGKREALELTEASREGHWEYPTFAGALFMGQLPWRMIHPFPQIDGAHDMNRVCRG